MVIHQSVCKMISEHLLRVDDSISEKGLNFRSVTRGATLGFFICVCLGFGLLSYL